MHPRIAILTPCFNESKNIKKFAREISEILKDHNKLILFVDDGSSDGTWKEIQKINSEQTENLQTYGLKLSRNFGKDSAITAGLFELSDYQFDILIIIDADLQHPIKFIKLMIEKWKSGNKVVFTLRKNKIHSFYREFGSKIFNSFMSKLSDVRYPSKLMDFMLLDKSVIKIYNNIAEKNKQFRSTISWLGLKSEVLEIEIEDRNEGNSKFNFLNLARYGINTFSSFSYFPIKFLGYLGLILSIISIILMVSVLTLNFVGNTFISYPILFILFNILLTGLNLSACGMIGLYVSKIVSNTNNRPDFIIEEKLK